MSKDLKAWFMVSIALVYFSFCMLFIFPALKGDSFLGSGAETEDIQPGTGIQVCRQ